MQRLFINIFPGRADVPGSAYPSHDTDDETWSWIDGETNETRTEDCISLASFPTKHNPEDCELDYLPTLGPNTYAAIANSALPVHDIHFPSTLKPTETKGAKKPKITPALANNDNLDISFADLRSASQAHKRERTHNEKYWNHRHVKAGQLGQEHYLVTSRHPFGFPTQKLPCEAEVTVMTKRMLFQEAQTYPRPPRYHRRLRPRDRWGGNVGVMVRMKDKKHVGWVSMDGKEFDPVDVDVDVDRVWASEAELLCQGDEVDREYGIGVWRIEPTRTVRTRPKRTKGRAAPRVTDADDWGGWV